ncbi:TetR/AcrR family transcriptional regulator [Sphingomonas abietis]|uniref:TetR/AcrR family transcriptional regulator n=1 Tax=Sphingomonas abietis TaxID=3012344 RepID=A0ABY7NLX4_9SPHN|nr:TetR/AcrR family transcriptional regulator [Sphingomonas abietis]WBO22557.1 TetR/AcrR family transcriptional regulator [Sphingomonas abietis]
MPILLTEDQVAQGRERIRRVAERQAVERGIERVSMHSIAQALGWSATALYRYYENKEAILAATRTAALDQLSETLEAVMAGPGDIWERSRAIGGAYVDFAFERPDTYRLIFALSQPDITLYPELATAAARARRSMTGYAEEMVAAGDLDADPTLLAHIFWAQLHGLISLQMVGHLDRDGPDFETIRHEMVRRIVHGIRKA